MQTEWPTMLAMETFILNPPIFRPFWRVILMSVSLGGLGELDHTDLRHRILGMTKESDKVTLIGRIKFVEPNENGHPDCSTKDSEQIEPEESKEKKAASWAESCCRDRNETIIESEPY